VTRPLAALIGAVAGAAVVLAVQGFDRWHTTVLGALVVAALAGADWRLRLASLRAAIAGIRRRR
jgi:phosphate/sulfate permease